MTDLNKVILIGRLTQNCGNEERSFSYVGNGTAKAVISLAVNRSVKKNGNWADEVSFINVTIWGKTAENLKQYLKKGTQICIEGYLTQDRWEKDGKKESRLNVTAESVQLLGGGNKQNDSQNDSGYSDNPFGN
jgi:single-strand DNA-binding protein